MESLLDTVAQRVENEVGRDFMRKVISLLIASSHFGITELRLSKLVDNEEENSSSHMNIFVFLNGLEVFLEHTGTHIQLKSGIYHDILKCKNDMALLKLYNTSWWPKARPKRRALAGIYLASLTMPLSIEPL